ncbi:MAG: hypothetical protein WD766_01520, partial [Gemmatimonadota bacterium]
MTGANGLQERLLAVIDRGAGASLSEADFERLALDVFAWQIERNTLYRAFCSARGATPASVRSWMEIPAVPTDAFKAAALVCGDPAAAVAVFRTSGTTRGGDRRGTHYLLDTSLYRASLRAGFRTHLLPDRASIRMSSLVPSPESLPDSSLSFMIGDVVEELGTPESGFHVSGDRLDVDAFVGAVEAAAEQAEPLLVVGTSLAFLHLLDELGSEERALLLPSGSRAMDTGGFKGSSRAVERSELYGRIERSLGIPATHIVNEYGMTEMSSQLYDGVAGAAPAPGARRHPPGPPRRR